MLLASALGSVASIAGLFIGYHQDTSAGGVIVLISTAGFFVAWLFAPRHGIIPEAIARRGEARLHTQPEAEAEVILASPEIQSPHLA